MRSLEAVHDRLMDVGVSVYGAALATIIAITTFVGWWRSRVRVEVSTHFVRSALDPSEMDDARGTAMQVQRGSELLWEEALIGLEVRNVGGKPVQIVAVLVESSERDGLQSFQVIPEPLPHVLDPGTRIEITVQKEVLDMVSAITFLGVVDALGRRYAPPDDQTMRVVQSSWDSPTRVRRFRSRTHPKAAPVLAFQMRDRCQMNLTDRPAKAATPLATRRSPLDKEADTGAYGN